MQWRTKITDLLDCKYPIIQGAFGAFGTSAIAAAVSDAGGLGIIAATALRTPKRLREDIHKARSMTHQPFGVNLSLVGHPNIDEFREVAMEERVAAIFTSAYNAQAHGKRIKEAGIPWIHKVATLKHALAAERHGADAVVIVGIEGVGEKSELQLTTLTSVTMAAKMLKVPVIAAGGIGDARSFLAALAMGAEAVYMGTAFMATKEFPISERYKQALVNASPLDPNVKNRAFAPPPPGLAEMIKRQDIWHARKKIFQPIDTLGGSMAVGAITEVVTARKLIDSIIRGAEAILAGEGPLGRILAANSNNLS